MKLIKVIKNEKAHDKDGNELKNNKSYYAIELENGRRVVIKPVFKDDYAIFDFVCETEFVGFPDKKQDK